MELLRAVRESSIVQALLAWFIVAYTFAGLMLVLTLVLTYFFP